MNTTTFIWKCYFERLITTEHPAVYQYIMGGYRGKESAVLRVTEEVYEYCNPYWLGDYSFEVSTIRGVARIYMKYMYAKYVAGEFNPKEIYQTPPYIEK